MSNLYDDIDIFRLIDEDGVILSAGGILEINEPEGMDEATISLERSKYHGVDFEFFDSESELGFDRVVKEGQALSGYAFLEQIFAIRGTEAKVKFQYLRTSTPDLIYDSYLIFSSRRLQDYKVVLSAERLDFDGNFKNRFETKYDINSTTTLEDTAATPVSYDELVLPPQNISRRLFAENDDFRVLLTEDLSDPNRYYPSAGTIVIDTLGDVFTPEGSPIDRLSSEDLTVLGTLFFTKYGTYTLDISYDFKFSSNRDFDGFFFVVTQYHTKYVYPFDVGASTPGRIFPLTSLISQNLFTGVASTEYTASGTGQVTFTANQGDVLVVNFFLNEDGPGIGDAQYEYVIEEKFTFDLRAEQRSKYLLTEKVNLFDALSNHFTGLTGVNAILQSSFLQNREVSLLSGKLVRGFPSTEPFKLTSKEAASSLEAIFGLGFSVNPNKVIVERYEFFYTDNEILSITENIKDFEITIEKKLIPNEINIGYKEFSKVQDSPLVVDSNRDFLTQHDYLTSIRKDKMKKPLISDWVASGYVFTEGKELSFGLYPEEKWDKDEKTFLCSTRLTSILRSQKIRIVRLNDADGFNTDQFKIVVENFIPFDSSRYGSTITVDGTAYNIGFSDNPEGLSDPIVPNEAENITEYYLSDVLVYPATGGIKETFEDEDIDLGFDFLSVETDEPFDIIDGVPFAFSTYNARYNIKNMLLNNSPLLNAGFNWLPSGTYKLLSFDNNADLRTQFKVGENDSTLDPDRDVITQSDDLLVVDANNGAALVIPEILTFETRLSFETIMAVRDAFSNEANPAYYGYISVTPYNGTTYKGFLKKMDYNPLTEMVKFTLIRKND